MPVENPAATAPCMEFIDMDPMLPSEANFLSGGCCIKLSTLALRLSWLKKLQKRTGVRRKGKYKERIEVQKDKSSVILVANGAIFKLLLKTERDGGENTPRSFFTRSCIHWPAEHWKVYDFC